MKVRFWGVRGSIPSPGPSTVRYGGNTSCVSIQLDDDRTLVLDAGTGIRELGEGLLQTTGEIAVLVTHMHWDHILGFPFFAPLYQKDRDIRMFPTQQGKGVFCTLIEQMDGAHFPVTPDTLPSRWQCAGEGEIDSLINLGFSVSRIDVNHPGGCDSFRVEHGNGAVVYMTDNELEPPYQKVAEFDDLVEFCRRADVLIHDAQYLDEEIPHKRGWGHSTFRQACKLALAAEVKQLVLFHHDPERTDDELDSIQEQIRAWLRKQSPTVQCTMAYEGLELEV